MTRDEAEQAASENARVMSDDGLFGTMLECQGILGVVRWDDGKHSMLGWERLQFAPSSRSQTRSRARSSMRASSSGLYKVEVMRGNRWQTVLADAEHGKALEFAQLTEDSGKRVRVIKIGS